MHYRLKSLFLATLVLSLFVPVGVAESQTQENVQPTQITQEPRDEALQLNELGLQQLNTSQFLEALKTFEQALAIHKQMGDIVGEAYTLNNIGGVYINLGEYTKALDYYQRALVIRKQIGDTAGEGATLNNIGGVYINLGEYAKAIDYYQRALAIAKKNAYTAAEGSILNNIGAVYDTLGEYAKALDYYQRALAIRQKIGNTASVSSTLNNIGLVYDSQRNYPKALEFYQQALAIAKKIGYTTVEGTILNNLGSVYHRQREYTKALDYYHQALAIRQKIGDKAGEGSTLNNIGLVYSSQQEHTKALDYYYKALAIRQKIGAKAGEGISLSNIGVVYGNLGKYAEAEKTFFAAIEIWESLRTRELPDEQKVSIFETQSVTYLFLQRILINQNKTNAALEIAERSRGRALVELLTLNILRNTHNQQPIKPPNIEQIQQIATAQKATLVQYSVNESDLYIWIVKPTGEIAFKQVDLKSLNTPITQLVTNSRLSIGAGGRGIKVDPKNGSKQKQNLQKLHEILIAPIASLLPANPEDKVIFIPHDSLFLVPFAALQDHDGKYLIEKHTILTAPAIQVLDLTRQQRQNVTGKDVLVMGNPIMPKVGIPPVQLEPLKGAEKEALTIANLFKIKAITGKDATKAAFKQRLSTARIIHLATHGLLDDPSKSIPSAIALTPTDNDNGLLTLAEMINLRINAELVVLSACDTGRGTITGDGVIGLSRALITAGAPSVIVSLWAVPDSPTSELMAEFYRQWEKNPDKAIALRNAMLITMKKHPQPVDWAAFTLIGES